MDDNCDACRLRRLADRLTQKLREERQRADQWKDTATRLQAMLNEREKWK